MAKSTWEIPQSTMTPGFPPRVRTQGAAKSAQGSQDVNLGNNLNAVVKTKLYNL